MFCVQCGGELTTEQKFCPACGHPNGGGVQKKEFPHDVLIRRAQEFTETFDASLDVFADPERGQKILGAWDFEKIDTFNPIQKLELFKYELTRDLMAFSKYEYPQEQIEEVVDEIYPISRKWVLSNMRLWIVEQVKRTVEETESTNAGLVFKWEALARCDAKEIYAYSRFLTIVAIEQQDVDGLQTAKTMLRLLEGFYCKNDPSLSIESHDFIKDGQLLHLQQFADIKQHYDALMNWINAAIVEFNPAMKEEIEQEQKAAVDKETKIRKKDKNSVITRVICGLAFPVILMLQHLLLPSFGLRFSGFPDLVVIIVAAVLCALVLVADVLIRNRAFVVGLNVLGLVLFFPLCWLVSIVMEWLIQVFALVFGIGLVAAVLIFKGDRTNL